MLLLLESFLEKLSYDFHLAIWENWKNPSIGCIWAFFFFSFAFLLIGLLDTPHLAYTFFPSTVLTLSD